MFPVYRGVLGNHGVDSSVKVSLLQLKLFHRLFDVEIYLTYAGNNVHSAVKPQNKVNPCSKKVVGMSLMSMNDGYNWNNDPDQYKKYAEHSEKTIRNIYSADFPTQLLLKAFLKYKTIRKTNNHLHWFQTAQQSQPFFTL